MATLLKIELKSEPESLDARVYNAISHATGLNIDSVLGVIEYSTKGIDPELVVHFMAVSGLKSHLNWVIDRRTLRNRISKGELLSLAEGSRFFRAAKIIFMANEVFADMQKARNWLEKPLVRFGYKSPTEMIRTEQGATLVEEALLQIDQGFSA